MKQIFFLAALFFSVAGYSQLEKSNSPIKQSLSVVKQGTYPVAELFYLVIDGDTTHTLMYRNWKYSEIVDFQTVSFDAEGGQVLKDLKELMLAQFDQPKDHEERFKLGDDEVTLSKITTLGSQLVFSVRNKGYVALTRKQIEKLFTF